MSFKIKDIGTDMDVIVGLVGGREIVGVTVSPSLDYGDMLYVEAGGIEYAIVVESIAYLAHRPGLAAALAEAVPVASEQPLVPVTA